MDKAFENLEKCLVQISESLERIEHKVDYITGNKTENVNNEEYFLDNHDVLAMLKISYRTLQRYRTEGILPYQNLRNKKGKVGYRKSDIQKFIKDYQNGDLNKKLRNKRE